MVLSGLDLRDGYLHRKFGRIAGVAFTPLRFGEQIMTTRTDGHQIVENVFMAQALIRDVVNLKPILRPVVLADHAPVFVQGEPFLAFGAPER